jgi:hypothetical protein
MSIMERTARQLFRSTLVVTALALCGIALPSQAAMITTLYNTGVNASNVVLGNGVADSHYTLTTVPSGSTSTQAITSAGGFPIGPWLGDNTVSRWIVPANGDGDNAAAGDYVFRTTFDLTGFDPATASISGQWLADNRGLDILLNGVSLNFTTSNPPGNFTVWTTFLITSGFQAGLNTLDFLVRNDVQATGNPVGLRVEMTGTASPVPLPAAAWLLLSGLVGFAALGRRRVSENA